MQESPKAHGAPAWSPSLVEWAFQALPGSLEGKDKEKLDNLRLRWEKARLEGLAASSPEGRVQALAVLSRHEWHPDLAEEAARTARDVLEDLDPEQLQEVAGLLLESAQLRLAEPEDLNPHERVKALRSEAAQVHLIREKLAGLLEKEGKKDPGAGEKGRLLTSLAAMERRLLNQADEARILEQLESVLGEMTWTWFSRVTFFGLLVLLALLFLDLFVTLSPSNQAVRDWTDTSICFLLLLEFGLRFWAAPRKGRWFLRHFLTDFVPALPFALLLPSPPPAATARARVEDGVEFLVRSVRLFRIPVYARYVRFLKPVVGVMRILLFWVRGMDRIVLSMAHILNRQIVFFENAPREERMTGEEKSPQEKIIHHFERLSPEMRKKAAPGLLGELEEQVGEILRAGRALPSAPEGGPSWRGGTRVLRAEELVRTLEALTTERVAERLPEATIRGLARLLALMDIPLLRSLPLVGALAAAPPGAQPAQRIARAGRALGALGRRIVALLTDWADLGGVVTAPQILNRIASAMIRSTQRPAVRLLLFGCLFLLSKLFFEAILSVDLDQTGVGRFLNRFVGTPLLVLGGVCLVVLVLGRWLKRLAGEASERLLRASEARFANLLELLRRRKEREDLAEMVRRISRGNPEEEENLTRRIRSALEELRRGGGLPGEEPVSTRARKLALLLLDFQDGALLHKTDTKTVEQFLSHPDLWSLRNYHLGLGKREERRLARLDLESGKILSGPFLWFDLATQALALKVARLCGSYNLHLLPLDRIDRASPGEKEAHRALLEGREGLRTEPGPGLHYQGSFFHVLHFLSPDPVLTLEVEEVYGKAVVDRLEADRRRLIREVFGVRPLGRLPLEKRSFNPLTFYFRHLGSGRFFLLPFKILWGLFRALWAVGKLAARSAREILDPRLRRSEDRVDTSAPFPVAQRKLRRMKKPLLLEAILLACRVDPSYLGLSPAGEDLEGIHPWRSDLELAAPTPPERNLVERIRKETAQRLLYCPPFLESWKGAPREGSQEFHRLLSAFAMDEEGLARLAAAGARERAWIEAAREEEEAVPPGCLPPPPGGIPRKASARGLRVLLARRPDLPRRAKARLKRAWKQNLGDLRTLCLALEDSGNGDPETLARKLAERLLEETPAWRERWETLQALLALIVRDLRHHEEILFLLGGYGEDQAG